MIRSMTGYGRHEEIVDGRDIIVEIKSVNHRFFEFSCRTPRAYGYIENFMKTYLQSNVTRGKVDVNVSIVSLEGKSADVEINLELAKSYLGALRKLGEATGIKDDISLSSISRFSDIFTVLKNQEDENEIWNSVKVVADKALGKFVAMRELEGAKMREDIEEKLNSIESSVKQVENTNPTTVERYREKLYAKISEVLNDSKLDEQRILTEAAIFAEKIAVDEETVRLKSHIKQFRDILNNGGRVGRKLDFLIQEFNRETNTIGSKAQDLDIARLVVNMKSDIEKIREQIQNIE